MANRSTVNNNQIVYAQFDFAKLSRKEQIALLNDYYSNNDLYETTRLLKYYLGVWNEDIRPLRTPVNRSVEFYVSKIAIGEPKISSKNKNQPVVDSVSQIMDWSNFQVREAFANPNDVSAWRFVPKSRSTEWQGLA